MSFSVLSPKKIEQNFPFWNKITLCELAAAILRKIDFLNKNGILLGTINPSSIIVENEKKVYFSDTDNLQIEGYPAYAYNAKFIPPEYVGKEWYLSSLLGDRFIAAELLFSLMLPGRFPYNLEPGEDPTTALQKMDFPYAYGDVRRYADSTPISLRFAWSHLGIMKNPLFQTFWKDGACVDPDADPDANLDPT